jgi:hypothetical protein
MSFENIPKDLNPFFCPDFLFHFHPFSLYTKPQQARESNEYLGYVSENIKSNLQEEVIRRLKETGRKCRDVRCR